MSDLVDRQLAIDALRALEKPAPTAQHLSAIFDCEDVITSLPSAQPEDKCSECDAWNQYKNYPRQPEIIRCKDCKHVEMARSEEAARKFGQIYICGRHVFLNPKPDDYCSWAERRTDG